MALQVRWFIEICEVGGAAAAMQLPTAQKLAANNLNGANGGVISLVDNPTGAQVDTALTAVATNAKAYFDNGAPLAQLQGFSTGGV